MNKREFMALIGGAAAAWPLAARAQQRDRMRRIGVLMGYAETDPAAQAQVVALRQELQKLGWDEGRNIRIDVRFPGTDAGRVRSILMELMSLAPEGSWLRRRQKRRHRVSLGGQSAGLVAAR
jgi:putative ABC transport system substrate-binding protein